MGDLLDAVTLIALVLTVVVVVLLLGSRRP